MSDVACPQCASPCEGMYRFCPLCGFPVAELSRRPDDPLIGTTLPGGYVLLEMVGAGGMARVYRAEQKALARSVAVKLIHPSLLRDAGVPVRFYTEVRAVSRVQHPNVVTVHDFGKHRDMLFFVMEFLRGKDLVRAVAESGPLPFPRIADILGQALSGLAEAHHLDVVHRSLCPSDIVVEPRRSGGDFVKVIDFGLAKIMDDAPQSMATLPGLVFGAPEYMAPEQGRGDFIDGRVDIYACGVVLYQLLTGRVPFEAPVPAQVVLMHLSLPPQDPREVAPERRIPDRLVDVTLKALEKDPDRRYQTADDFARALRAAVA